MAKSSRKPVKEKLWNVPNPITGLRVFLAFVLIIMYLIGFSIFSLLVIFIIAAFTDFLDGFLARRLNQETLFGARFDILADRILWVVFGLLLVFGYPNESYYNLLDFLFIFSREIICGFFLAVYIILFRKRNIIPYTRYSGKILTTLQGFIIPSMILSVKYSFFEFYKPLLVVCLLFGLICSTYYIVDLTIYTKVKNRKFRKYYDFLNPIAPAEYQK